MSPKDDLAPNHRSDGREAAMIPRGEVILIFAGIGKSISVISDTIFSALIMMVIITTLITPPALRLSMSSTPSTQKD